MRRLTIGLLGLCSLVLSGATLAAYTVEDFFKNPQYTAVTVSPNGKYLAAIAPTPNNRRNIAIIDLQDRSRSKFITGLEDQDVAWYTWGENNDRLLFGVDADGAEGIAIFAVDRDGGRIKTLIDPLADFMDSATSSLPSPSILDVLEDDPKHILISYDQRRVGSPDVYRVNINNGGMKMVERNPGTVAGWITDHDGKIRGAFAQDKLYSEAWYRDREDDEWRTVARFHYDDPKGVNPLGFAYDNKHWYVHSHQEHNTAGIYKYDPTTGELGELIFRHAEVDAGGLIWSDKKEKILAATYFTDKPHWVGLDEEFAAMVAGLEKAFPDKVVNISNWDEDEDMVIVSTSSDTDPGSFYLLYREENKLEPLVDRMPWIDPAEMTEMRPIKYTARDGMTIHGYLTVPKDSDGKDLPLIVNPHGGPWARDFWRFNPEHQFFASRGYAVMQMNFRGSTGYGRELLTAGYKQWGRGMQNDISDGVKWAIEEGIADPERVCIYGGSYGGYATMAGLTFTPELYKCGVNYVGVTDVALLFKTMPDRWNLGAEQMKDRVGDPDTEEEFLAEISPVNHVDKIKAPVFIVHGRKDPRVSIKHADKLRGELEDQEKPYEWLVKNNEGHGFSKEENRIELYTAMAEFFDKHIGRDGKTGP